MHKIKFLLSMVVSAFILMNTGCSTVGPDLTLRSISNLQAYSKSAAEVGLTWTASPDADIATKHHITVTGGTTPVIIEVSISKTDTVIGNLTEGVIYTFSVVVVAQRGPNRESRPATIQWSPARRLTSDITAPIDVFEIRSTVGESGMQFYDDTTAGPRVRSIEVSAGFQQVIDVLLDTTTAGVIVLESAHLNPLLQGQARRTRFSTFELNGDSLNISQVAPPAAMTYTRDSVTIGSGTVSSGKIFYAVSHDTNYVRILVQRHVSSGTLLLGNSPDRRIRVQLSYQGVAGVIFAKRSP